MVHNCQGYVRPPPNVNNNLQKDVGPDTATNIIFWHAVVNIGPVRVVDDLAWSS